MHHLEESSQPALERTGGAPPGGLQALNVTPETPLMITLQDGKLTVVAADIGFSDDEIDEFFDDIRPEYDEMLENLAK